MEKVFSLNFNESCGFLVIGSSLGLKIFRTYPLPIELIHSMEQPHGFSIVEMVGSSQVLCLVGNEDLPNFSFKKMTMWNAQTMKAICECSGPSKILGVRINDLRILSISERVIYVYDTASMRCLQQLQTAVNGDGLAALSASEATVLYPSPDSAGEAFHIYDCYAMTYRRQVAAHKTPLKALSLSHSGQLAATASGKGTVIRLWSIPEGENLYRFKRGMSQASIWDLRFVTNDLRLACTSNSGTIHIFDIGAIQSQNESAEEVSRGSWSAYLASSLTGAASYLLPEEYTESLEMDKSVIQAETNFCDRTICAVVGENLDTLLVVGISQEYEVYQLPESGTGKAVCISSGNLSALPLHIRRSQLVK